MPRFAAIADTNFYRRVSDEALEELRALERASDSRPMASFLACEELLSHLADPDSPDYRPCRAAVRRMFLHCFRADEPVAFPIIAEPHGIIAYSLFNLQNPNRDNIAAQFAALVLRVAMASPNDPLADISRELLLVRRHRDDAEEKFVESLEGVRRQFGLDPQRPSDYDPSERPSPKEFIASGQARIVSAGAIVNAVASEYHVALTDDEVDHLANILMPEASAAVGILEERLRKVLLEGASPRNQANDIWDIYFALISASHISVGKTPVLVITTDGAIQRAADRSGGTSHVVSPERYKAGLAT